MTPLHLAAECGRIRILYYFVEQRADINIQDDNGVSICDHTYSVYILRPGSGLFVFHEYFNVVHTHISVSTITC